MGQHNHLLIADPDPQTLRCTAQLLEDTGYHVWQASSSAECLKLARLRHPGLILLDIDLANRDEIEHVCEQARTLSGWQDTFIVLTVDEGQPVPPAIETAKTVDVWIRRPFSEQTLRDRIQDWFRLKQARENLRKAEAKWRLLLRSIPSLIAELDLDGTIITLNKVLPQFAMDAFLGKQALHVLAPANHNKLQRAIDDVIQKGISIEFEAQDYGPKDIPIWYSFRLVPMIKEGKVKSLILILDDITRRKQDEAQLRFQAQLLDSVRESVVATDVAGNITYWGKGAESLYGYTAAEVKGQPVTLIVEPQEKALEQERIRQALETGSWRGQYRQKRRDGSLFWADTTISLVTNENSEPIGLIGIDRNITDLKETEATLRYRVELEKLVVTLSTNFINLAPDKIDEEINRALHALGNFVGIDRSYVFLYSEDNRTISNTHEWCRPGIAPQQDFLQSFTLDTFPWWGRKLQNFEHISIIQVKNLPPIATAERAILEEQNIQSLLAVPMIHKHRLFGFLGFDSVTEEIAWQDDDINLLSLVGNIFVNALVRQQADGKAKQRSRELAILNKIMTAISYSLELTDVLDTLKTLLPLQLNMFDGVILLYDQSRNWLTLQASWGLPATMTVGSMSLPVDALRSKQAIQTQEVILSTNFSDIADFFDIDSHQFTWEAHLTIPLLAKGQIQGIIFLLSPTIKMFQEYHMPFFETLGRQIGITIENARLFEQVRTEREQSRRLTQQVVSAQEEERRRLSRELHDEAGQALTALKITQELIREDLPAPLQPVRQRMDEVIDLTDSTIEQIRLLAHDLRPPALDTLGLNPTLEGFCRDFARRTNLTINYTGISALTVSEVIGISLYRFLQEALTNAAKHANPSQIDVQLRYTQGTIYLSVDDDGRGFKKNILQSLMGENSGIGLLGMQERLELLGGWLEIESQPDQGVHLTACVPWEG